MNQNDEREPKHDLAPQPDTQPTRAEFNDPDDANSQQSEAGTQAQDVAEDAQDADFDSSGDSERGGEGMPVGQILPDDTPDLVEKMNEMVTSGRIDMDAFAGEEYMEGEDPDE